MDNSNLFNNAGSTKDTATADTKTDQAFNLDSNNSQDSDIGGTRASQDTYNPIQDNNIFTPDLGNPQNNNTISGNDIDSNKLNPKKHWIRNISIIVLVVIIIISIVFILNIPRIANNSKIKTDNNMLRSIVVQTFSGEMDTYSSLLSIDTSNMFPYPNEVGLNLKGQSNIAKSGHIEFYPELTGSNYFQGENLCSTTLAPLGLNNGVFNSSICKKTINFNVFSNSHIYKRDTNSETYYFYIPFSKSNYTNKLIINSNLHNTVIGFIFGSCMQNSGIDITTQGKTSHYILTGNSLTIKSSNLSITCE